MQVFTNKGVILTPFLLVLYLILFLSTYLTDRLPSVPDTLEGLDIEQAWADLQRVCLSNYPMLSFALIFAIDRLASPLIQLPRERRRSLLHPFSFTCHSWRYFLRSHPRRSPNKCFIRQ